MKKLLLTLMILTLALPAQAAEKNWLGDGDGLGWQDDTNWFPVMAPTPADDVIVNALDAPVLIHQEFTAKSLSIGGNVTSSVTIDPFVSGTIAPASASEIAVLNGVKGKMILGGGAGVVTLRGVYKDSETPLSDEPALVFYFE